NAGLESGESPPFAGSGGHSVWWKWTAPVSGEVTFNTAGSSFDTVLSSYVGTTVNALTFVAGNDDFNVTLQSSITFEAQSGFTYYIRVDGFDSSAVGNIALAWSQPPAASTILSAILPYARSVQIGQQATAFGVIINAGTSTATSCSLALPAGIPGSFIY